MWTGNPTCAAHQMTIQISELKVELRTNSLVELYNMKCMGSCSSLL